MTTEILGIIAGLIISCCYIPQIIKIYKTKRARDISLLMYIMLVISLILWIIYSFKVDLLALKITNILGLTMVTIILANKIIRMPNDLPRCMDCNQPWQDPMNDEWHCGAVHGSEISDETMDNCRPKWCPALKWYERILVKKEKEQTW